MRQALRWLAARPLTHRLLAGYLGLVFRTKRWQWLGTEPIDRWLASGQACVWCFWHNRMAMMAYARRSPRPHHILISPHRDGQLIAAVVARFGIKPIFASSSRRPVEGFRQALAVLERGEMVCITPDGPRGPRMRASAGVIQAARMAGVPIVPLCYASSRRRVIGSWDRFVVPLPFARGIISWGEPIAVPRDADEAAQERLRALLEDRLNAQARALDERLTCPPIEPAPAPVMEAPFKNHTESVPAELRRNRSEAPSPVKVSCARARNTSRSVKCANSTLVRVSLPAMPAVTVQVPSGFRCQPAAVEGEA